MASRFTVIIPCHNEEECLPLLKERLVGALDRAGLAWEALFIDDGSTDSTLSLLEEMSRDDHRIKAISLSRNFGHQSAISAGLHHARAGAVGIIDADLQDPPEFLVECFAKLEEGYDVVYAVRRSRKEGLFKRAGYKLSYRILRLVAGLEIPSDAGDFCAMSERAVAALKDMPEREPYIRGQRAWIGFRQIGLSYDRDSRIAGESKYGLKRSIRLMADASLGFSKLPLQAAVYFGLALIAVAMAFCAMSAIHDSLDIRLAAIGGFICLGGAQLVAIGFVGIYIGRIFDEVRQRPKWIVKERHGFRDGSAEGRLEDAPTEK